MLRATRGPTCEIDPDLTLSGALGDLCDQAPAEPSTPPGGHRGRSTRPAEPAGTSPCALAHGAGSVRIRWGEARKDVTEREFFAVISLLGKAVERHGRRPTSLSVAMWVQCAGDAPSEGGEHDGGGLCAGGVRPVP